MDPDCAELEDLLVDPVIRAERLRVRAGLAARGIAITPPTEEEQRWLAEFEASVRIRGDRTRR